MPGRALTRMSWRCLKEVEGKKTHGKQSTLECCTLCAYLGQPCPAVDLNMHDYPSYPRSTTLCPDTSPFSKKDDTCISFEYVTGPVIHNKYMFMRNIQRENDGEITQNYSQWHKPKWEWLSLKLDFLSILKTLLHFDFCTINAQKFPTR